MLFAKCLCKFGGAGKFLVASNMRQFNQEIIVPDIIHTEAIIG